jgi:hypothetical protein
MAIEKPGSLTQFAENNGLTIEMARSSYSRLLDEYRENLASILGITKDQLHEGDFPRDTSKLAITTNQEQAEVLI